MALYHLSVKAVQRSKNKSSVAKAAYRAGENLYDKRTKKTYGYSKKIGVVHTEIIGYPGTRSELWNAAEDAERRKDATVAKEYEVSLPRELNRDQYVELASLLGQWLHEYYGCVCDVCIHDKEDGNPHVHILTTTRSYDQQNGQFSMRKIARDWPDSERIENGLVRRKIDVENIRKTWSEMCNEVCQNYFKVDVNIDHRSNENRGILDAPAEYLNFNKLHKELREEKQRLEKKNAEKKEQGASKNIGDCV